MRLKLLWRFVRAIIVPMLTVAVILKIKAFLSHFTVLIGDIVYSKKEDIDADTTDGEITELVGEYEFLANDEGFTLSDNLEDAMKEHRQELRKKLEFQLSKITTAATILIIEIAAIPVINFLSLFNP